MREILFRGKRIDNGKWVEGDLLRDMKSRPWIYWTTPKELPVFFSRSAIVNPNTIGQYTGKTDMHGVKIFEGNKVRYDDDEIGYIEWDEETARFIISGDGVIYDFDNFRGDELEVIGNIHDNPELVKEDKQ